MRTKFKLYLFAGVAIGLALSALTALAQPWSSLAPADTQYDLSWRTVDGGGEAASDNGAQYALTGTIGQADAGASSDSQYGLVGGFWGTGSPIEHSVYLPLVLRNVP